MLQRIVRGALGLFIVLVATLATQWIARHLLSDIAAMLVTGAVALLAYAAQARWIERRAPGEIAPSALAAVPLGFLIGCGLFATTIFVLAFCGNYRFQGFSSWQPLATGLELAVVTAVFEELIFRGFLFRWLQSTVGTWLAVAASAMVFGLSHVFNEVRRPSARWRSQSRPASCSPQPTSLRGAYGSRSVCTPAGISPRGRCSGWQCLAGAQTAS